MTTAKRVLVVDDYAPSRYGFRRMLHAGGMDVVEAGSAREAREALTQPVDVVLLDVNLPDTDGLQLCREIRTAHPDTPVVLISVSYRSADAESEWRAAGASDFIEQPVLAEQLLEVVRRAAG